MKGIPVDILGIRNAIISLNSSAEANKKPLGQFITNLIASQGKALAAAAATKVLQLAMTALNVAISMVVSYGITKLITHFQEAKQATQEMAQKSKETTDSLKDLVDQYKELGDKSGWDTDDFAQAKDLNAEILDLLKNQSAEMDKKLSKLDLENGKYQEQIDLLNELSISTLTQNKADQGKLLEQTAKGKSSGQYVIGDSSDTDMANALGGKFGGSLDSNTGVFNFGGFNPNEADSILAYYDKLSNALDYLGSNYDSATLEASSLYNQLKSEKNAIEDQANAYRSSSDTLKEVIAAQKLSSTSSKRSEEDIKAVTDALEGLKGAYGGITSGNLVSFLSGDKKLGGTYADALNQLKEVMLNLGFEDNTSDAQAFVDVLVQLGIVSSSSASKVDGLSESTSAAADQLKEATDGLDKIQSAYSTLSDVVDEYNENGYLTVSTLTDLINLGPEYYDCLVDESGQLAINTENINTMADAYYEMAKAALYAQAIESLNANTNTYANASKFLSQAQQEVKDMKSLLYAEGQRLIDEGGLSGDALATQVQAQQRIINTYSAMMDLLDKTHAQSADNQFRNPKDKNSNKSSNSEDKMTDAVSAWETLSAAMEEYNQYGNLCISTLNDLLGLEDDYTSLLTEQNGKMSINTTEFKNLMFAQIAQANATDESGKSAAELKRILQYVDENVKGDTISFEQLTDAIDGYGTAMDKAKQKTDAIKSAFSGLSEVSKNKIENPFGALDADDVDKKYQAIRDLYDNTDLFTDERFAGALNPETGLVDYDSAAFKKMFLEKLDGMATACEQTGGKAGKYLAQGFRDAEDKIKNNVISIEEYINGIGSTLENINNRMDNFQSAFNDLSDIVDEYNAYGDLSQDSIQKLMGLDVKYTACLELQGDKLVFNKEAFRALYVAQLQKLAADYEGTDIGKRYAEILQKVADGTWDVTDHMKGMGTEAQNLQTIFSNLKDLFSSLLDVFNKFNDNNSNDLKIYGDAMTDEIDKRIEALQNANDEQEKAIELAKLQAELGKAETQKTVRVYTSNGYEWQADKSAIKEARDNLNSKQRENALNDEIDKLNKLKDKYTELINMIGSSYEDYQKKQAYAAKIQGMTFDQMTDGLDGYKDNIIANMKAIQGATNVNNIVTNLTNLVNTLVKLNDVLSGLSTGTTQSGGITGLFNRLKRAISTFSDKSSGKGFFGRLLDAGKSFLGVGSSNKYTVAKGFLGESTSEIPKLGQTIAKSLGNVKTTVASAAQGIFSGDGGLKSIFQKGFSGVASIAQKAVGGLGSIFGNISTTLGGTKLFSGIAGIFKGIGKTVSTVIGTTSGTGVAGTIAAAVSHIPVIGKILLGGTLAVSAIGGGSFGTGIKRIGSGIVNIVKGIGSTISKAVKGVGSFISKLMPWNWGKSSSDSGSKKKGIGSWKIWPWNWGRAKGDKHIDQAAPYNVDEEGEEIIVRNPAKGRMTYLEKGDGVIPADTTENLMEIGKDPKKWLSEAMKESGNSVGYLPIDDLKNAKTKGDLIAITKSLANNQMKRLRDKFDTVWKRLGKNAGLSEEQIDTIGNTLFDRMNSMISNSMDSALGNKNLTDDQIKTICAEMFQRMGSVYKNGWDNLYSLSPDMSTDASTAINKLFETIFADYNADTSNISDILSNWLPKVENTMNTTPASGLSGGGGYYGNSMDANIGPSASFSFSKVKETIQDLFEKFSNSKFGAWLNKHSLGSTVDKLTKYNSSSDPNMVQKALHLLTHPTELIASAVESAVKTGKKVTWAITHPKEAAQEIASAAKDAYAKGKEVASNVKDAVTHPKETAEKIVDKVKETYSNVKEAVSEKIDSAKNWIKDKADKITGKKAAGSRSIGKSGTYNVDEKGQELIVRQPEAGRYTYLETGDGVVPADITSKLFDLGGNPDAWFQKQLAKNGGLTANVQNRSQAPSISIGDIYVQKPIGDVDDLAREIVQGLPNAIYQECSKR